MQPTLKKNPVKDELLPDSQDRYNLFVFRQKITSLLKPKKIKDFPCQTISHEHQ